jgi:hypothetical protein
LGHVCVFIFALLLGIFGPLEGTDVVQTVMMACPVLGATAMSALSYVLQTETAFDRGLRVSPLFSVIVLLFPISLLGSILLVFYFVYIQVSGFGPDNMKISLGGIETIFGVYLGAISVKLFGGTRANEVVGPSAQAQAS